MGHHGRQTPGQPSKLCDFPARHPVPAQLVYKLDGACDWGAVGAVRCGHVFGSGTTVVCGNTGGTDVAHDVGE